LKVIALRPDSIITNKKAARAMTRLNHGLQEVVHTLLHLHHSMKGNDLVTRRLP
jgi:hypothetical protein